MRKPWKPEGEVDRGKERRWDELGEDGSSSPACDALRCLLAIVLEGLRRTLQRRWTCIETVAGATEGVGMNRAVGARFREDRVIRPLWQELGGRSRGCCTGKGVKRRARRLQRRGREE